MNTHSKANSRI